MNPQTILILSCIDYMLNWFSMSIRSNFILFSDLADMGLFFMILCPGGFQGRPDYAELL